MYFKHFENLILCLETEKRRERKSENRSEETHVYMKLLRRQALPDPQTNHPPSSQPDVLPVSVHVRTTCITYPRHYVTPLRDSNGYEVPVHDAHSASQGSVYCEIQDGEDNYDDVEVESTLN